MNKRPERDERASMLKRLSGTPEGSWGARLWHHGARLLLIFVLAGGVTFFFPPVQTADSFDYEEGTVADEDVIAEVPFTVPKAPSELDAERRNVMDAVPPTFEFRPAAADTMEARLNRFFDELDSAAASNDRARAAEILQARGIGNAGEPQIDLVFDDDQRATLRQFALLAVGQLVRQGVLDSGGSDLTTSRIAVREGDEPERFMAVEDVLTLRQFIEEARLMLPVETTPEASNFFGLILVGHFEYSLVQDLVVTQVNKDAAARTVSPVKEQYLVGQAIVRAADPIGPEAQERLRAYEAELADRGLIETANVGAATLFGAWLVNVIMFSLFGLLLFFSRPEVYGNFRWLLLTALLVAAYFAAAVGIDRTDALTEWLPIAFVALPVAVLWDSRMALTLVLILVAVTGTLPPFSDYGSLLALMAAGAAAAMSVRAVRRRSETWVSIAIIAAAGGVMLMAHGLATTEDLGSVAARAAALAGNATVSALLAMGFLFVFELFTGITTDQTLLEWADPTRPLLRRLSLEAPGTYAHTINVANLAEAAATEVGANGLLARVGLYYHDVGKMLKPHYFVENQPDGRNPHDKLKPETSAAIVKEHVTEGVRLAREENVPDVVLQFILEHHGTQRIGFFYEKAREEAEGDVDEERFYYPGPKPQSKETAIAMLADSCESATRAMQEPTPERVKELIDTIVQGKIADGQLDDAPLTLSEIARVKDQFVKILSGVIHRRIEYPSTKHLTDANGNGDGPEVADPADEAATQELHAGDPDSATSK